MRQKLALAACETPLLVITYSQEFEHSVFSDLNHFRKYFKDINSC